MMSLAGKIAVVTGGSAGIGLGIAKRLVLEGASVVIAGRRQAELEAAAAEIGTAASVVRADVADLADLDRTFAINVKGVLFTVQKALPLLTDGASVIVTGSSTSIKGTPAFSVYSATKAAVRNFARACAIRCLPIWRPASRWDASASPTTLARRPCFSLPTRRVS